MKNIKHKNLFLAGVALLALGSFPLSVEAQVITSPSDLPAGSDPARIIPSPKADGLNFEDMKAPRATAQSVANIPKGADKIKFILKNVEFVGATAYSKSELSSLYKSMMGQSVTLADMLVLSSRVQQKYFDDGYSFVRVSMPEQNVASGQIRFNIIEGGVGDVIAQNLNTNTPLVKDALEQIRAMRPVNVLKLERLLLVLNDFVDGDVTSVISSYDGQAGRANDGFIKVALVQQTKQTFDGLVGFNNAGSIFSGPYQAQARLGYIHAPFNYSKATLSLAGALPLNDMKNVGLSYRMPVLGASGAHINLGYTRGWTEAGHTLDPFDIIGQTEIMNAGFSYSFLRQRDIELTSSLGFEAKNIDSDFLGNDLYRDRIRVLNAGLNYTASDPFSGVNFAAFTLSKGLNQLGARETGSLDLSRDEGRSDFFKVEGQAGRVQSLPLGFEFYGNVSVQWTNDPLLSSEEFGFGGAERGRGFTTSEITGDRGVAATVEVRKNMPAPQLNLAFQPFVFYDVGVVKNLDSTDNERLSAASAGVGVRVFAPNGVSGDVTLAKPLTRAVDNPMKYAEPEGVQVLFSVQKAF